MAGPAKKTGQAPRVGRPTAAKQQIAPPTGYGKRATTQGMPGSPVTAGASRGGSKKGKKQAGLAATSRYAGAQIVAAPAGPRQAGGDTPDSLMQPFGGYSPPLIPADQLQHLADSPLSIPTGEPAFTPVTNPQAAVPVKKT